MHGGPGTGTDTVPASSLTRIIHACNYTYLTSVFEPPGNNFCAALSCHNIMLTERDVH